MRTPDQVSIQPPFLDQPRITPHAGASSVAQLIRLSSAGRDGMGSRQRAAPESSSSPGLKTFTRHNLTFSPVNSSKPPMPPQNLNNNRSSSGDQTRRPRPKLDRSQRSNVSSTVFNIRGMNSVSILRSKHLFPFASPETSIHLVVNKRIAVSRDENGRFDGRFPSPRVD